MAHHEEDNSSPKVLLPIVIFGFLLLCFIADWFSAHTP